MRAVAQAGWTSFENGELLRVAATAFDVLVTTDQNLEFHPATLPIAVIVLVADSNRLESLEPLVPELLEALGALQPKTIVRVGA